MEILGTMKMEPHRSNMEIKRITAMELQPNKMGIKPIFQME